MENSSNELAIPQKEKDVLTFEEAMKLLQSKREALSQELATSENTQNVSKQLLDYNLTKKITVRLYDDLFYRFLLKLKYGKEKATKISIKNRTFITGKKGTFLFITLKIVLPGFKRRTLRERFPEVSLLIRTQSSLLLETNSSGLFSASIIVQGV